MNRDEKLGKCSPIFFFQKKKCQLIIPGEIKRPTNEISFQKKVYFKKSKPD
jgi:hypothetical protein